jgi:hypothetical protein
MCVIVPPGAKTIAKGAATMTTTAEVGAIPVFYVDGVLDIEMVPGGPNVRIIWYEMRLIDGEQIRVPVLEMVRPTPKLGRCDIHDMMAAKLAAKGITVDPRKLMIN